MKAPKRAELVKTAQALFAKEGFKGVSVDRLVQTAGVAKMTLYKGFRTKDELILETLRQRDRTLRNWKQPVQTPKHAFLRALTPFRSGLQSLTLTAVTLSAP